MKKLLTIIVPLAMLLLVASVGMAAEEGTAQDLNRVEIDEGDSQFDDPELNDTNSRDTRALAAKRGRQPRRGQTASDLSDVQKYWGDHGSGNSEDEMPDEDEDGDVTPPTP